MAKNINGSMTPPPSAPSDPLLGISRDDDPTTLSLRGEGTIDLDDIASNLNTHYNGSHSVASSSRAPTESIFSSQKESTKPTSYGTSYPVANKRYKKGKVIAEYASSLSATHGSGSDTEREREMTRYSDLRCFGGQFGMEPSQPSTNKRTKRPKKVDVILHQHPDVDVAEDEGTPLISHKQSRHRNGKDSNFLRQRRPEAHHEEADFTEDDDIPTHLSRPPHKSLSPIRFAVMIFLIALILLTFVLSVWGACHTGKARMHCTKRIIFIATIFLSALTVLTMLTARRALHEALLTGLLELFTGFTLCHQLKEFM